MIALIDGDIVAYRVAATVREDEDFEICEYRIDVLMQQIFDAADSEEYKLFVKGSKNFRYELNPDYKANRKDMVKPVYLDSCYDYLVNNWNAIKSNGIETDDNLGINQTEDTVICSIDKDLLMIPGQHWNFVKCFGQTVSRQDGLRHFYKQMLIGDTSDNIFGVKGIGPKKAEKLIDPLDEEQDMFNVVYNLYNDPQRFVMNANCLWIMQKENELWVDRQDLTLPEKCQPEVEAKLNFMKSLNQTTSTELGMNQTETSGTPANGTGMDSMQTNDQPWT